MRRSLAKDCADLCLPVERADESQIRGRNAPNQTAIFRKSAPTPVSVLTIVPRGTILRPMQIDQPREALTWTASP
jgi:hypothetical protein